MHRTLHLGAGHVHVAYVYYDFQMDAPRARIFLKFFFLFSLKLVPNIF